jgi:hypothetical protein
VEQEYTLFFLDKSLEEKQSDPFTLRDEKGGMTNQYWLTVTIFTKGH